MNRRLFSSVSRTFPTNSLDTWFYPLTIRKYPHAPGNRDKVYNRGLRSTQVANGIPKRYRSDLCLKVTSKSSNLWHGNIFFYQYV